MGYLCQSINSHFRVRKEKVGDFVNALVDDYEQPDIREDAIRFEDMMLGKDEEGNINSIELPMDKHYLDKVAPFVLPGSYIDMLGEDGTIFRWLFLKDKIMTSTMVPIQVERLNHIEELLKEISVEHGVSGKWPDEKIIDLMSCCLSITFSAAPEE